MEAYEFTLLSVCPNMFACLCIPPNFVVFYTIHAISKKSRRLLLLRTSCYIILFLDPSPIYGREANILGSCYIKKQFQGCHDKTVLHSHDSCGLGAEVGVRPGRICAVCMGPMSRRDHV
jgi:hypothetical protein